MILRLIINTLSLLRMNDWRLIRINMRHPEFSNKTLKAVFYNYSLFFCKQKKACFETFLSERAIFSQFLQAKTVKIWLAP